jgi:hypothetical protein
VPPEFLTPKEKAENPGVELRGILSIKVITIYNATR